MIVNASLGFWCSTLPPLPLPRGVHSLVCLILNLTFLPWLRDWRQAAWPIHQRQDLSPMCGWGQLGLHLFGPRLPSPQGPARGTQVLLPSFGRDHATGPGHSESVFLGKMGSEGHSGEQATFSQSAYPDTREPAGAAGPRGTQLTDPVSTRTCPPVRGWGRSSLSGGGRTTPQNAKNGFVTPEMAPALALPEEMIPELQQMTSLGLPAHGGERGRGRGGCCDCVATY